MDDFILACGRFDFDEAMRLFRNASEETKRTMANGTVLNYTVFSVFVHQCTFEYVTEMFPYIDDVNQRDGSRDGHTPLTLAVEAGRYDITKFLLDQGADINLGLIYSGETPTHIAFENNISHIFELLLSYHPNIHSKSTHYNCATGDNYDASIYERATQRRGSRETLRIFVDYLISRGEMNSDVATDCFEKVVTSNDTELIHTILAYGVNDNRNGSPLICSDEMAAILACERGVLMHTCMVRSFRECVRFGAMGAIKIFAALGVEIRHLVGVRTVVYEDNAYEAYEIILSGSQSSSDSISTILECLAISRDYITTHSGMKRRCGELDKIDRLRSLLLAHNFNSIDPRDSDLLPSLRKKANRCLKMMKLREEIEELRVHIGNVCISKDWQSLLTFGKTTITTQ